MKRRTIIDMEEIAKSKNGKCLSLSYINCQTKLRWQCKIGHEWEATPSNIIQGTWCPICAKKKRARNKLLTLNEFKELAISRKGKCLSNEYMGVAFPLKWECEKGHQWKAKAGAVKRGTWCPYCANVRSVNERICRAIFEQAFKFSFKKARPTWLRPKETKRSYELDGYCEQLQIAFEYQGEHHYSPIFNNNKIEFIKQKERDAFKVEKCKDKGIYLIIIPPHKTGDIINIHSTISKKYKTATNKQLPHIDLNLTEALYQNQELSELSAIAKKQGGECLSQYYLGAREKILWRCAQKHEWLASPDNIKRGRWCPKCARKYVASLKVKHSVKDLNCAAQKKGGVCLSTDYLTTSHKYKWKCALGHVWFASFEKIKAGRWCPECGRASGIKKRTKHSITELKTIAKERKGKVLSDSYPGYHKKIKLECSQGHKWETTAGAIIRGSWCPICANKKIR